VKRLLGVALGILTAIGGFVDIGDLVTNAVVGSRFGLSLVWVVLVGVIGLCVFANMSGRVAAASGRATFEVIRERLGPRAGLADLAASVLINLMTVKAELSEHLRLYKEAITGCPVPAPTHTFAPANTVSAPPGQEGSFLMSGGR
jgi:Natural resistance-associated macrophage protein